MATETRFLSDIEHPNIIKMRAIARCDPFSEEYFIAMDRLYDTLEKRLKTWEGRMARTSGMAGRLNDRKGTKAAALYEERIVKAFDLAAAVDYLHKVGLFHSLFFNHGLMACFAVSCLTPSGSPILFSLFNSVTFFTVISSRRTLVSIL
jgi:hypothetical protein